MYSGERKNSRSKSLINTFWAWFRKGSNHVGIICQKKLLLQLATDTRLSRMKKQDARFKTEVCGKWHTYVGAGQRSCKKTLTNKYKYVAFLRIPSRSPPSTSDLPSPTDQAGPCGRHPSGSTTDWKAYLLFPATSYLLLPSAGNRSPKVTKPVSHKHTPFCWESCFTGGLPNPPQKKPAG